MGFKCGLVGLPNVGKSTIFNALTKLSVPAESYPFCTVDPNVGIVPLQDERLEKIAKIVGSKKVTPTVLEFVDIAGLVQGASKGEGLGNQFLNHIQMVDAIAHIVRCFEDENVAHITSGLDPIRDVKIVIEELILKDLEWVENRLHKTQTAARAGDSQARKELDDASQQEFMQALGLKQTGLQELVRAGYEVLNLITFFTANENEARAWTIPRGTNVVEAAAAVHSDFKEKFIKAEVTKLADLFKYGSQHALHEHGLVHTHGRDYVVELGDLIYYRIGK